MATGNLFAVNDGRAKGDYDTNRTIRMSEELWNRLGEAYGVRKRSEVVKQVVAYLLREPGAKLPPRAPQSPTDRQPPSAS